MGRSNVAFRNGAVGIMSMVRLMIVIVGDYFGIVVGGFTAKFDMGLCWLHLNRNRNYLVTITRINGVNRLYLDLSIISFSLIFQL